MLFTWLIGIGVATLLVATFLDEIMNWAKDMFNRLSNSVKQAWVYIRRVPGGIMEMLRYILNGRMVQEPRSNPIPVEWEEVERMYKEKKITKAMYEKMKADQYAEVAEMNRNR